MLIGGVPRHAAASPSPWDVQTPTTTITNPYITGSYDVSNDPNLELLVEVGYNGQRRGGSPYTIFVEVSSKVLFTGVLVVSRTDFVDYGYEYLRMPISKSVEIAAGTTHQFTFTLDAPSSLNSLNPDAIIYVELLSDAGILAVRRGVNLLSVNVANVDLVGVFPGIAGQGLPSYAPMSVNFDSAQLEPIDPANLRTDLAFLQPFDIIVVTANDLNNLEEEQLDLLSSWVNQGGSLLVDESPGTPISGIPQVWHPDSLRPVMAGQGEILLTNGLARSGNWDLILDPTSVKYLHEVGSNPTASTIPIASTRYQQLVNRYDPIINQSSSVNINEPLFEDSGFSLPNAFLVILVFVAYVVIAGPVMWFSLKRRNRRELIWLGVPILAIVLSLGLWVFGSNFRGNVKSVHVSMVDVSPRGSVATSYLLQYSPTGDARSISQPLGWSTVPIFSYRQGSLEDAVETVNDKRSSTVEFQLSPGEFFVLASRGVHTEFDNALEVSAELHGDGRITGTIVNNLSVRLYDIVVYAHDQFVAIPEISPRGVTQFDMSDPLYTIGSTTTENSYILALSEQGLWNELAYNHLSLSTYLTGQVVATALTDELDTPLDGGKADGYTLLVARGPVETAGSPAGNLVGSLKLVGPARNLSANDYMLRFVVPEDAINQNAVLVVTQDVNRLSFWMSGAWHKVDLGSLDYGNTISENEAAMFLLPVGSYANGRVHVRASADDTLYESPVLTEHSVGVRTLEADDILSPVSYLRE